MLSTKEVIATAFRPLPLYIAAAALHWAMSLFFEYLQRRAQQRLDRAHAQRE
jgi:cystine transport system permease protein